MGGVVNQQSGWHRRGNRRVRLCLSAAPISMRRLATVAASAVLAVAALAGVVTLAPEVFSTPAAGAANVYTNIVNGTTGVCSAGWYTAGDLVVPAGVISTQVTLVGGGGG